MRFEFMERNFAKLFSNYIDIISRYPLPFFIIPLVLSFILSTGIYKHSDALIKDEIELYTPTNARAHYELKQLESLFYINDSDPFYASRRYNIRRTGYIIVTSKTDSADILSPLNLKAILRLWSVIQSFTIDNEENLIINDFDEKMLLNEKKTSQNFGVNYSSMCIKLPIPPQLADIIHTFSKNVKKKERNFSLSNDNNEKKKKINDFCVSNPLLELFKYLLIIEKQYISTRLEQKLGNLNSTENSIKILPLINQISTVIPKNLNKQNLTLIEDSLTIIQNKILILFKSLGAELITNLLGGVELNEKTRQIASAKAIMLPYALKHETVIEDRLAEKWELKLAELLKNFNSPQIRSTCWTYETLNAESARDREQLKRMFLPCFTVIAIYTILQCCVYSWQYSRPLFAFGGVVCAAMSITSSIGLLLHCGFQMTSIAYSMPFIVFSVGVDNVFILLSAWRVTNPTKLLNERLKQTFSDAAVSITITSLTDVISFGIGCLTPFPSVYMFCVYAVVAVIFTYFYQLTFLAAIMYWTSLREVNNLHCLTFCKLNTEINKSVIKSVDNSGFQ